MGESRRPYRRSFIKLVIGFSVPQKMCQRLDGFQFTVWVVGAAGLNLQKRWCSFQVRAYCAFSEIR